MVIIHLYMYKNRAKLLLEEQKKIGKSTRGTNTQKEIRATFTGSPNRNRKSLS